MRTITTSHRLLSQHVYRILDFPEAPSRITTIGLPPSFLPLQNQQVNKVATTLLTKLNIIILQLYIAGSFRPVSPDPHLGAYDAGNLDNVPLHRVTTNLIIRQL